MQHLECAQFSIPESTSQAITFSLVVATGNSVEILVGGQSATLVGSDERQAHVFFLNTKSYNNMVVKIKTTNESATFSCPKVEATVHKTAHIARIKTVEQILCRRYFYRMSGPTYLSFNAQGAGNYYFNNVPLSIEMRIMPTVVRQLDSYSNQYLNDSSGASTNAISNNYLRISIRANAAGNCEAAFNLIDCDA